ncbi:MAG: hypothetical protein ACREFL_05450 [Stellaceae bacterium]
MIIILAENSCIATKMGGTGALGSFQQSVKRFFTRVKVSVMTLKNHSGPGGIAALPPAS